MITELLKELNTQLRKHPDVKSVLNISEKIKNEYKDHRIHNIDTKVFNEASYAFITNIKMLVNLKQKVLMRILIPLKY